MFYRSSSRSIGCDPHTEVKKLTYVLLCEPVKNSFAITKSLELRCIKIRNHVIVTDVDVELIPRSAPTCM